MVLRYNIWNIPVSLQSSSQSSSRPKKSLEQDLLLTSAKPETMKQGDDYLLDNGNKLLCWRMSCDWGCCPWERRDYLPWTRRAYQQLVVCCSGLPTPEVRQLNQAHIFVPEGRRIKRNFRRKKIVSSGRWFGLVKSADAKDLPLGPEGPKTSCEI